MPVIYFVLFGGLGIWLLWDYRHRGVRLRSLFGPLPPGSLWRSAGGIWLSSFVFSLGAFQFTYGLLAGLAPDYVASTLEQSLFLGPEETRIPLLYNALIVFLLVVAAPVLEELLFRGALIHRWGSCWNGRAAVVVSSVLFGLLHANWLGIGMFGLVLALLYLQTRSLWLAIAVHAFNNAVAATLGLVGYWMPLPTPSLSSFQQGWWLGLLLMAVTTPLLVRFIRRCWPLTVQPLPYFANHPPDESV
jgi:membrane protease YdiL (CAAX protease family)